MLPPSDNITILHGNRLATKRIFPDGSAQKINPGKLFGYETVLLGDLHDLHCLLQRLESEQRAFAIRGVLRAGIDTSVPLRRCGENFTDASHHWVCLDFDGIDAPEGMDPTNPGVAGWLIHEFLPPEFRGTAYIAQFSASAGTLKAGRRIKLHLWFWFARPIGSDALRQWAGTVGADTALFNAVQPHYVAGPIFDGWDGPALRARLFYVEGREVVDFTPPEPASGRYDRSATPVPPAVSSRAPAAGGLLDDGREAALHKWLFRAVLARRLGSRALDRAELISESLGWFRVACGNADGKWPNDRIVAKVNSTVDRAENDQIAGLPHAIANAGPHYPVEPQPMDTIRPALATAVKGFFGMKRRRCDADVVILRAPPGSGKTRALTDAIPAGVTIDVYLPTIAVAEQLAADIGSDAGVMYGRRANNCLRHTVAADIAKVGLSVTQNLCDGCPHRQGCGYFAQRNPAPRVRIWTHAHLALPRAKGVRRGRFAVIDEGFWQALMIAVDFSLDEIARLPAHYVVEAIEDGLRSGTLLAALRSAGITSELLAAWAGNMQPRAPIAHGSMSDAEICKLLKGTRPVSGMRWMLLALARELGANPVRDSSNCVWWKDGRVHMSYLRPARMVGRAPLLILDAQANERIICACFPDRTDFRLRRWDAVRNAEVIQTTDTAFPTSSFLPDSHHAPTLQAAADLRIRVRLAAEAISGRVLVVTSMRVRLALTGEPTGGKLPVAYTVGNVDFTHFAALKGLNQFARHDAVVVVGRTEPSAANIELSRGIWWRDANPIRTGDYGSEMRRYDHASGQAVAVRVHPDSRIQALVEQVREWHLVQALDRLRLFDGRKRLVLVLCNLPLPGIRPSMLTKANNVVPPIAAVLADEANGVFVGKPAVMVRRHPARFATAKAAENWLAAGGLDGSLTPPKYIYGGVSDPSKADAVIRCLPVRPRSDRKRHRRLAYVRHGGPPVPAASGIGIHAFLATAEATLRRVAHATGEPARGWFTAWNGAIMLAVGMTATEVREAIAEAWP